MTLRTLRWLTVAIPVVLAALFLAGQRTLWHPLFVTWPGFIIELAALAVGASLFSTVVFRTVTRLEGRILKQNHDLARLHLKAKNQAQRLRGLHQASVALTGELDLEELLQQIVDLSREIAAARFAALIVLDENRGTQQFLTSGLSAEEQAGLNGLPQDRGILGLLLDRSEPLRSADLTKHSTAAGFPDGHPCVTSFLGIPILIKGKTLASIYLTNKIDADEFSLEDQETLSMFAAQAAVALENARLYQRIQTVAIIDERERIAREMHDSLAQVLGYVSTKTQGIQEMVRNGEANIAIENLGQMKDAAQRSYADVREGILALRHTDSAGRGILASVKDYAVQFSRQSDIPVEVVADGDEEQWRLSPLVEVQLLRIVQEALTNVRRHARASVASVYFSSGPDLRLTIEDDGRGFNPLHIRREDWPHLGLQAMQERAEAIGATFSLNSSPGNGTKIVLTFRPSGGDENGAKELGHARTVGG